MTYKELLAGILQTGLFYVLLQILAKIQQLIIELSTAC
jgi:hypothetical protein